MPKLPAAAGGLFLLLLAVVAAPAAAAGAQALPLPAMRAATVLLEAGRGHGSGVLVGPSLVLTAGHVADRAVAGTMAVTFAGGERVEGVVVWRGEGKLDAALLSLRPPAGYGAARLDCRALAWGEEVATVGMPTWGRWVLSRGIVASLDRTVQEGPADISEPLDLLDLTIQPGSSGGPLFGADGRLRGIVTASMGDRSHGGSLAFALPAARLCPALPAGVGAGAGSGTEASAGAGTAAGTNAGPEVGTGAQAGTGAGPGAAR